MTYLECDPTPTQREIHRRFLEGRRRMGMVERKSLPVPSRPAPVVIVKPQEVEPSGWREPISKAFNRVKPVVREVARLYSMTLADLTGSNRRKIYIEPRHVAAWMCQKLLGSSFPEIGRCLGDRDHTTILHAVRKIDQQMAADPLFAAKVWKIHAGLAVKLNGCETSNSCLCPSCGQPIEPLCAEPENTKAV